MGGYWPAFYVPDRAWPDLYWPIAISPDTATASYWPAFYNPARAWPDDYWPKSPEPLGPHAWDQSIAAFRKDLEQFEALLLKPDADLYKPFRWGEGQNLLREALLIADHNAYHLGELIVLRRLLGIWNP